MRQKYEMGLILGFSYSAHVNRKTATQLLNR